MINKLGLNGIGELGIQLAVTGKRVGRVGNYPISESELLFQIVQNLPKIYKYTTTETSSFSELEELVAVGKVLLQAKVIEVYVASANLFLPEILIFKGERLF